MDFLVQNSNQFDMKPSELEILYLIMEGRFIGEIANRLNISIPTAAKRQRDLLDSWGCHTIIGLTIESFNRGHLMKFKEIHERTILSHRTNVYLSDIERRLLQLMVYDISIEEIAKILDKKERRTKEIHVGIIQKFGIRNDMQLLAIALHNRLVSIPVEIAAIRQIL